MKVKSSDLADAVMRELRNYSREATETMKETILDVSKETVKDLKQTSPKLTGDYAKKWKYDVAYETSKELRTVIHVAKPEYPLTHLLEKGHAKRNGGRTRPIVHIQPAEERAIDQVVKRMERKL